jgi:hypothetical protein
MVETLNFKMGATIIKLNTAVWGILMSHCGRDKNTENIPRSWLNVLWGQAGFHLNKSSRS